MRIERVDDKTVKCYISGEELEEYNIDYKDFITRSDKAREIVQEIIMQAEVEVGYKPPKYAFDLQIMLLPDRGLILTFSEKDADIREEDQIVECLKEMKRILQKTKEKLGTPTDTGEKALENIAIPGENASAAKATNGKASAKQPVKRPEFAVFVFSSLGKVMEFAAALPTNLRVESSLYKMDGFYYLYFLKGHASQERYSRACI